MGEITLVIGGTRSGKTSYAVNLAKDLNKKTAYIATCMNYGDEEMDERIRLHQLERPAEWETFEEPLNPAPLLQNINSDFDVVIIDCLTLFTSNLLLNNLEEDAVKEHTNAMLSALKDADYKSFLVSNEVGLGIVPENALARKFRDVAGRVNQIVAQSADNVVFVVSGIPMKIKGQ